MANTEVKLISFSESEIMLLWLGCVYAVLCCVQFSKVFPLAKVFCFHSALCKRVDCMLNRKVLPMVFGCI